ncbi:MAG: bifunctional diaminohydroxyphosphoribosylaminopyrimidine deaminase/5-amino-6-(5-phosphoribosylamino)uracil reductase RibD [Pseudomonadota bacterium]
MTYYFSGVIGLGKSLDFQSLRQGLGGVTRNVFEPFEGVVHAFAADYAVHFLEDWERLVIADWSRARPADDLIYLQVECFGGACLQGGFVMRGGNVVLELALEDDAPSAGGETPLQRMLAVAGVLEAPPAMPFLERKVFDFSDEDYMRRAFALAASHLGQTGDNPSVGCVLVERGAVVSEAVTGLGGRPHAEEEALDQCGGAAQGATAFVTLEPCRERSSGAASCSERLIRAGVERLVYAADDPHPLGSGGVDQLRGAGIRVEKLDLPNETQRLYGDFFRRVRGAAV